MLLNKGFIIIVIAIDVVHKGGVPVHPVHAKLQEPQSNEHTASHKGALSTNGEAKTIEQAKNIEQAINKIPKNEDLDSIFYLYKKALEV
ncbi:15031_t:CDS:2 [Cetraspora pellucida]|uniref:15031_t:CDS:1 n=1 Tax=Cetraspora pellucida TaxID=1433469 RepID=A0ACA9K2X4_9GLOM|nr:15031_t:CDS:2 [Cetraspora pellucida]